MSRPPLHALEGFVAAARSGNVSRAAAALHLTVSALSHRIRGLEQRMGCTLFVRGARGVQLTDEGRALFERVAPHFEAIEHALRPRDARADERIALTVLPSFASSWLVPRLPAFLSAQPQLELSLHSAVGLVDFERERAFDAGIRFGRGAWDGLDAVHLFDDWLTPVASPELLRRLGMPTLRTLCRQPLLGAPGGRWASWFERYGGTAPDRFVALFDEAESLHRAAAEGLGIALGRMTLARPLIEAGRLVAPFAERLKADYAFHLVLPPRSRRHAGVALLRDWLLDEARRYDLEATPVASSAAKRARRPRQD